MNASPGWAAREGHSSVAMPDGSIVLTGGKLSGTIYKNDTWRSTDNGATWTLVNGSSGWTSRSAHSSVAMPDGSIVLMGGFDIGGDKNDVWRSTDNGATWTQVNASAGWTARESHRSVAMPDGSIVLTGGYDGDYKNDTWRFQPTGSSLQNPSHTYTTAGIYQVALQAFNIVGYNSTRKTGYINVTTATAPVADFTGTPTFGNAPITVQFNDTSTCLSPTSWNWSFGDTTWFNTTSSLESNATHTYTAPGSYTVSLTVTNATGNNTKTRTGYIVATNPPGGGGGSDTSGGGPGGGPGGLGAGGQQQGQGQQQGPGQGQQQGQQQQQGPGQGQQQVLAAAPDKTETISVNTEGLSVTATAAGRQALTIDVPAAEKAGSAVSVRGETIVISQPGLDIIVQAQGIGFGPEGTITGTIQSVGIATAPVTADISIGQVSTSIDASVSSIPTGATVTTTISEKVSSDTQNAFQAAAAQNNLQVQAVAYTMTIEKTNLDATGPATITMTSPAAWVNQHGGHSAIQIGRIGDDRVTEMLTTSYAGMDAKGNMVFEGFSRHGLSIFGMISAKASQIKQEQQGVNVSVTSQETPVTPLTVILGMATWAAGMVTGNIFFMGIGATMLCVVSYIVWKRKREYDWFFRK